MSCIVAYWLQSLKRSLGYLISVLHSPRRFFSKHFTRLPPPPRHPPPLLLGIPCLLGFLLCDSNSYGKPLVGKDIC